MSKTLNDYATESRADNDKWWYRLACRECKGTVADAKWCQTPQCSMWGKAQYPITVPLLDRNKAELIALMHSELSECLEGIRRNKMDDKLVNRKMEEVELVDCLIRIFDYAGNYELDLEGAYQEKRAYNKVRKDHSHEARNAPGGKQF